MSRILTVARQEEGMSLIELIVTVTVGMVVLLALGNLLDAAGRASAEVHDRVDATQRGRVAVEQITQRLRSQVCLDVNTPAIAFAGPDDLGFYTDLGDHTAGFFPEARRLRFMAGDDGENGSLVEDVWNTTVPGDTPQETADATFGRTPDLTRTIIADVAHSIDVDAEDRDDDDDFTEEVGQPLFDFYRFISANPATPNDRLTTADLANPDRLARVVRVVANFDARPTRAATTRGALDTRFETDVFVRTADPTNPNNSPSCF